MKFFKCDSFHGERLDLEGCYQEYLDSVPGGYISVLAQDGLDTVVPLLIIDLDTRVIEDLLRPIEAAGLKAEIYDSGSKGFHAHIQLQQPLRGSARDVCFTLKTFVRKLVSEADISIYRPMGIVSAPGRVHPLTGRLKERVTWTMGEPLSLELMTAPPRPVKEARPITDILLDVIINYHSGGPQAGERNLPQWRMAADMAAAGVPVNVAFSLMCLLNKDADYPDDENEIYKAVKSGYRNTAQKTRA